MIYHFAARILATVSGRVAARAADATVRRPGLHNAGHWPIGLRLAQGLAASGLRAGRVGPLGSPRFLAKLA